MIETKDDEGKLFWSFPKGYQEVGGTDTETAIRETKEETGLDVKMIDTNPIKTSHLVHNDTAHKNSAPDSAHTGCVEVGGLRVMR